MNKEKGLQFLLALGTELKRSFECPVVLLTLKDYAIYIFNSLVDMRSAVLQNAHPDKIAEIVNTFHNRWLQAVGDIENFKKRAKNTPRETIFQAFDYTTKCMEKRHKLFEKYIDVNKPMTETEKTLIEADTKILGELQELVNFALIEKQNSLRDSADKAEFQLTVLSEIEELLNWLDRLNDFLALQFCKLLHPTVDLLPTNLMQTLQQTIDEVACYSTSKSQKASEALFSTCKTLSSVAQVNDLGIDKVVEKIKQLEDRIAQLKNEKRTAGLNALQHKAIFLEDRLESLKNLNLSLSFLKKQTNLSCQHDDTFSTINENDVRIFNHLLPHRERCRLVEKLIKLWQSAINGDGRKSIISILNATDIEEFADDMAHFMGDKHGRKIYTKEGDHQVYQPNEINDLVPGTGDKKHVYFYDEYGRHYLTESRVRIYKANTRASEYLLQRSGFFLKVSEEGGGVEYQYDNLGRYYVNGNEDYVYRNKDSTDEYRSDGLGNLVKIRANYQYYFETCPSEPIVTEESKYLKKVIGAALKTCVAEVVMALPLDPIKYLADRLEKYWRRTEAKQQELLEEQELAAERKYQKYLEPIITEPSEPEEESVEDLNF